MNKPIPEQFRGGVQVLEGMPTNAMVAWLESELRDKIHILPGREEDYPVQAIINHHPHLTLPAQQRFSDAVENLVMEWRNDLDGWTEEALRSLLNIAGELRILAAKEKLKTLFKSGKLTPALRPAVLRTIAMLSTNQDQSFWFSSIPKDHPEMAGMAFQVLMQIAKTKAIELLKNLPHNEIAVNGVARKLPEFVSQYASFEQKALIKTIGEAIAGLPSELQKVMKEALSEEGFDTISFSSDAKQILSFRACLDSFFKDFHFRNTVRC